MLLPFAVGLTFRPVPKPAGKVGPLGSDQYSRIVRGDVAHARAEPDSSRRRSGFTAEDFAQYFSTRVRTIKSADLKETASLL